MHNMTQAGSFEVKETLGGNQVIMASGNSLGHDGMVLDTPAQLLSDNRFLWLEFGLPATQERVKALAEVTERGPFHVKVRFKHLFPDQRKKLNDFLASQVSMN